MINYWEQSRWEIANIFKISQLSIENHLYQLGYVNHMDDLVPYKLWEKTLTIFPHAKLLLNIIKTFILKQIGMSDEKWIPYNNVEWKRFWSKQNEPPTTPKAGLHAKKVMLCLWWNSIMSSFWKNQSINSHKYCFQLELDEKCQELVNWKSINLHVDNVKPHVSLMTRQKLLQLGWEILIQLPYSLDIIPSGINLFWFLQNSLNGKIFSSLEDCKRHLEHFFTQSQKVLGRWKYEVVWKIAEGRGTNGEYVVQ